MDATIPLVVASLGLGTVAPALPPAKAEPAGTDCVTTALTPEQLAAGGKPTVTCYPTLADALSSTGIEVDPYASRQELLDAAALSSTILAIHYDGSNGTGGSLSVNGTACNGGGISFTGSLAGWDNRVSSTRHYLCGTIKHWDASNYAGDQETTSGGLANLSSLSNRSTSISYH